MSPHELDDAEARTVKRATERLRHWGYEQATESLMTDVLAHAFADEQLEDPLRGDTVICCDCAIRARPSCERDGHGLVELTDLIDTYSNPMTTPR